MGKKVLKQEHSDKEYRHFDCPGCGQTHSIPVKGDKSKGPVWGYNWNDDKPTFTPSILTRWVSVPDVREKDENGDYLLGSDGRLKGAKDEVCHSFVREGKIQFLNDCTHKLAGQTVDLIEIE